MPRARYARPRREPPVGQHGASDPRAVAPEEDERPEPLRAPDRDEPHWRYRDGERLTIRLLLAGQPAVAAERIALMLVEPTSPRSLWL